MDPAYLFAAVVLVVCLALLALVIWRVSRPKTITPFSDDRSWWWDGKKWQATLSSDGLWKWDGYRWSSYRADGRVDSPSESLARGLANPNEGARFARDTVISLLVAAVLFGVASAISERVVDHAVAGAVGFGATRYLLSRIKPGRAA